MIDVRQIQDRLGVSVDGDLGRATFAALFAKMGAGPQRAGDLALGAAIHCRTYAIVATPLRLAHFLGQCAHESGGFKFMEELGTAAYFARYEGRKDLGNTIPGDGALFHGRGPIQLTGRLNYRNYGRMLGLDFENNPQIVALPATGILVACKYWVEHGLNTLADADDVETITRRINGGTIGLAQRKTRLATAKAWLL